MNSVFEQMLSQYRIVTDKDRRNAIYEVMQQITLAGLYRGASLIMLPFMVVCA